MKNIIFSNGKQALIDDKNFEKINQYKWTYFKAESGKEYARREKKINGERIIYLMHRVILNAPSNKEIDHINGNGLDNRESNLRVCSHLENMRNRKLHKNNTSGFKGVSLYRRNRKWRSEINVNKKTIVLGSFNSVIDAAKAYDAAAKIYFNRFAKYNFN